MNIDAERKAFEAAIPLKQGLVWYASHGAYMAFAPAKNSHANQANGEFASWLKAKLHAAEMAKPVASIRKRKDHHQWAVYVPTSLTAAAFDFPHKEDAIKWAVDRGYRVE